MNLRPGMSVELTGYDEAPKTIIPNGIHTISKVNSDGSFDIGLQKIIDQSGGKSVLTVAWYVIQSDDPNPVGSGVLVQSGEFTPEQLDGVAKVIVEKGAELAKMIVGSESLRSKAANDLMVCSDVDSVNRVKAGYLKIIENA